MEYKKYTWCENCSSQIDDSYDVCPFCNFRRRSTGTVRDTQIEPPRRRPPVNMPRKREGDDGWFWIAFIAGAVIFIGGIIWLVWSINDDHKSQSNREQALQRELAHQKKSSAKETSKSSKKNGKTENALYQNAQAIGKPLTQWYLMETDSYGTTIRCDRDMSRLLKTLDFKVSNKKSGGITAKRGSTRLETYPGDRQDSYCVVLFGTQRELDDFITSLESSGWKYSGNSYRRGNDLTSVRINGAKVTITEPF